MISLKARMTRFSLRLKLRSFAASLSLSELRSWLDSMGDLVALPKAASVQPVCAYGIPSEWITPAGAPVDVVILHLHGGGYTIGSHRSHRGLVGHIAAAAGVRALVPDYRLAPEHEYPSALEDAVAAYRWLIDNGIATENIVLSGDSAGGGLAIATLVTLRDQGIAMPAGVLLISPWTDLDGTGESIRTLRRKDPLAQIDFLLGSAVAYAGDAQSNDPCLSPVHAELSGLPPMLIQTGDCDVLLSDAQRLADSANRAGVATEFRVWEGMWHVWHAFVGRVPESDAAIQEAAAFIRKCLASSQGKQRAA